jgi:hypothetical protein
MIAFEIFGAGISVIGCGIPVSELKNSNSGKPECD